MNKRIYGGKGIAVTESEDMVVVSKYVPNPKMHLIVSIVKSTVRMIGYSLIYGIDGSWAIAAASVLIMSELIGIYEELV